MRMYWSFVFAAKSNDCMMDHSDLCPEQTVVCNFLKEQLLLNYTIGGLIKYKQ